MTIGNLITWFYCLDIPHVLLLLASCTLLFCYLHLRWRHHRAWRYLTGALLLLLMAIVIQITVGKRSEGIDRQIYLIPFHSYRAVWAGGNPEIYRSNFMNMALFFPAGLLATSLLPGTWPGWRRCLPAVLLFLALSTGIESLQYRYALGVCEIDDVIHNTAGALIGSLAALWVPVLLERYLKALDIE